MEDRLIPRAMRQHSAADWPAPPYVQAHKRIHIALPRSYLHAVSWRGNGWTCFAAEGGQRNTEPGALTRVASRACSLKQRAMPTNGTAARRFRPSSRRRADHMTQAGLVSDAAGRGPFFIPQAGREGVRNDH